LIVSITFSAIFEYGIADMHIGEEKSCVRKRRRRVKKLLLLIYIQNRTDRSLYE